jgi:excisionase family DNA binding protein
VGTASIEAGVISGRFCTIREAAAYLGVGETFVKERIRRGEIDSVVMGAGRRVVVESVVAFADAREREARRGRA